jgi:(2Fe-2S) ferredoxin
MQENELPYTKIIFVCCNSREEGERVCCASQNGVALRDQLKAMVRERGYHTKIRVSSSGCMGKCEEGANMMIFPDNTWLAQVEEKDLKILLDEIIADIESM